MADKKQTKTSEEYQPGTVDEETHGWAPDSPGTGEAAERVTEANKKAWEARDTQEEATGAAEQGPDLTGGKVGESTTRRGEDIAEEDGAETWSGPPKGESQRPTGGFTDPEHVNAPDPNKSGTDD
ncbi:MAG: hypothetical protein J2P26_11795 [Nocardiopsaceae bacterium]|nr:hypothetical protein [Nocardiopsaceae bacterium]